MRAANGREAALEAMRRQRRAGAYSSDAVDAVMPLWSRARPHFARV